MTRFFRTPAYFLISMGALSVSARSTIALADTTPQAQPDLFARSTMDTNDLGRIQRAHPQAAELFEKGEALLASGKAAEAANLFRTVSGEARGSALAARRLCEALTQAGQRSDAIAACQQAISNEGSPMDFRAMVGALMSGRDAPTTDDLGVATMFTKSALKLAPSLPWGYAAECDIARRLGDRAMLNHCTEGLQRLAPNHPETARAAILVASLEPGWKFFAAWAAVGAACLATLVHAMRGARRTLRKVAVATGTAVVLFGLLAARSTSALAGTAEPPNAAQEKMPGGMSKWSVNDADPESSVPTPEQRDRNPLEFGYHLMDLGDKADRATKRGDHAAAVKFYRALIKAVPDRSVGYSKLCSSYEALGEWQNAVDSCKAALGRAGVQLDDYAHYVRLVLAKKGALTPAEIEDIDAVRQHLQGEGAERMAIEVACELGVRTSDVKRLEGCVAVLSAKAPNDAKTLSFQWALALQRGQYEEAKQLVERAKQTKMKPEDVRRMELATLDAKPSVRRFLRDWRVLLGLAFMLGAGLLFVLRRSSVKSEAGTA
jgi:tetratricopeptide (TPR) repeat protein